MPHPRNFAIKTAQDSFSFLSPTDEISCIRDFAVAVRRHTNQWSKEMKRDACFWLLAKTDGAADLYENYKHLAAMCRCPNAHFFLTDLPLEGAIKVETNLGAIFAF